jgi:homoserine trans-succinylase
MIRQEKKKGKLNYNYCNKKIMINYKKNKYLIYSNWIAYNIYQKMKPL